MKKNLKTSNQLEKEQLKNQTQHKSQSKILEEESLNSPEIQQTKRISYSELKNWVECPYRHKLVHIDKLPYFSGNEYTAFGTAIHEACENKIPNNSIDAYKVFLDCFKKEILILEQEGYNANLVLIEEMKLQAKILCKNIVPKIKEHFPNFEVFSTEEALLEDIVEFDSSGRKFKGFIDLILKTPDGKFHIIDWKTCSWGWDSRKKADKILGYQLIYYKNYFSKKYDIDLKQIETYFALLKRTAKKNNVEIFRITSGKRKIENSLKLLQNAVINIEKGMTIKNRLSCKYCKFHNTENCT